MSKPIPHMFADATATLEDLHSIAVEGHRADNAPDMNIVLLMQLRAGLNALDGILRAIKTTLDGQRL